MNMIVPYFRVNEMLEPLNALMMTEEFLEHSEKDIYYLKWAIIAAHNALQGFMVLALKGTSNLQIIKWKEKEYKHKSAYEVLSDPKQELCCFLELFRRIRTNECMHNAAFKDEFGKITESINDLNETRNQFIHYLPLSWSIGTLGVVNILHDTMEVISFLTSNCIEVQRHYEESQLSDINRAIKICNSILLTYGGPNNET